MKKLLLASLLFAAPALAEQPASVPPPTASEKAVGIMYSREIQAHQADLASAFQLNDRVTALTDQVAALTKQITDQAANVAELTKELKEAKAPAALEPVK